MVSSNTESGISVTYQDGDGTLDFQFLGGTTINNNADNRLITGGEYEKANGMETL